MLRRQLTETLSYLDKQTITGKTLKQFIVTPSAGKRLIAKAVASNQIILDVLKKGTLVIVAGTTNGYVAQEVLKNVGVHDFSMRQFFRGITLPPNQTVTKTGRLPQEQFPGDVIIVKGKWQKGKALSDVADSLGEGDVILKGANAVDLQRKQAAVLIGDPKAGTTALIVQAVAGRRVRLIIPVGLEKRVHTDLYALAVKTNLPQASGYRLMPIPGEVVTEIEALKQLTGADAEILAAGGVWGAEGSCLLAVVGTAHQEQAAEKLWTEVAQEPPFDRELTT
jgi:hypothetical protein